jgi:DNA invertase Pin-like site-specific DNA recombinase
LQRILRAVRRDDIVVAVVTDRTARDPVDMLKILRRVSASDGALELLDEPFIDSISEMADLIYAELSRIVFDCPRESVASTVPVSGRARDGRGGGKRR